MPVSLFFAYVYTGFVLIRPHEFISFLEGAPVMPALLIMMAISWWLSEKHIYSDYLKIFSFLLLYTIGIYLIKVGFSDINEVVIMLMSLFILYGVISTTALDEQYIKKFLKLIVLASLIMSVHSFQQIQNGYVEWSGISLLYEDEKVRTRYIGIFNDPNDLGMILAASLPLCFYFLFKSRNFLNKVFYILSIFSLLYAIHLTDSRGTTLSVIVTFILYLLDRMGKTKATIVASILVPVLLALSTRMASISVEEESAAGRIDAWSEGMDMLKYSLFVGVGFRQFLEYHFRTAHNSYILALAELGIIGYFLWFKLVVSPVVIMRKIYIDKKVVDNIQDKHLLMALYYMQVSLLVSAFFLSRTFLIPLFVTSALLVAYISSLILHNKISSDFIMEYSNFYWFRFSLLTIVLLWLMIKILI